jgi:hypothetical protein
MFKSRLRAALFFKEDANGNQAGAAQAVEGMGILV